MVINIYRETSTIDKVSDIKIIRLEINFKDILLLNKFQLNGTLLFVELKLLLFPHTFSHVHKYSVNKLKKVKITKRKFSRHFT